MGGFEEGEGEGEERLREGGGEGGVYLPACSVLLYWSLCVIIDSKRSGRIGGKANPFFWRADQN